MANRLAIFKIFGTYRSKQQAEGVGATSLLPLQTGRSKPVGDAQYTLAFPLLVNRNAPVDRLVEIGSSKDAN